MCKEIELSEIQIVPVKPNNGLIAFASFVLNDQFYVGSVAVYTLPDGCGYRLVYPAKTLANGKQVNLFHPITKDAGETIKKTIIRKYEELLKKSNQ